MKLYDVDIRAKVVSMYNNNVIIKDISKILKIYRVDISRILKEEGINVCRKYKPFTIEHKQKIAKSMTGKVGNSLGKKYSGITNYKNMKNHLSFEVELGWLCKFEDINKLKFLNKVTSSVRMHDKNQKWDTHFYIKFIEKFYYDVRFNLLYNNWIDSSYDNWKRPSLDHIDSVNRQSNLDNFQFLTWFENRCKNNIPNDKWIEMKNNINEYFN